MQNYTSINTDIKAKKRPVFAYLSRLLIVLLTLGLSAYLVNRFVFQSRATLDKATVTFSPTTKTISLNETFTQSIRINTGEKKLSGVELIIEYDPTFFEYLPQSENGLNSSTLPANYFSSLVTESASEGQLRIVLIANKKEAELTNNLVLALRFKAIKASLTPKQLTFNEPLSRIVGTTGATGTNDHTFDIDSSQAIAKIVIGETTSCSADAQCGANASCNSTSTCVCAATFFNCDDNWENGCESIKNCTATGEVNLKISLKLQGVANTPKNTNKLMVELELADKQDSQKLSNVEFISSGSNDGIFVGNANFDKIVAGTGYELFVKGPKHVRKRFCSANPTGGVEYRCTSGEKITIVAGENLIDLTQVPLLSGDIPLPQDGVLNSKDVVALKKCINNTEADCINLGDLNLDGVVRANDYSLMIESMAIKYDDEN